MSLQSRLITIKSCEKYLDKKSVSLTILLDKNAYIYIYIYNRNCTKLMQLNWCNRSRGERAAMEKQAHGISTL
jgi:hypothetical protein